MKDYSWQAGDPISSETVPAEARPVRFALTAPQCILRRESTQLLLIDPHPPGTWSSWMFPYASLVLDADDPRLSDFDLNSVLHASDFTFGQLADLLRYMRSRLSSNYEEAIRNEVNNVIPGIGSGWDGDAMAENYSIKYSKTAGCFTAYMFEYFRVETDDVDIPVPAMWVPIDEASSYLTDPTNLNGRTVSSNVMDVLPLLS